MHRKLKLGPAPFVRLGGIAAIAFAAAILAPNLVILVPRGFPSPGSSPIDAMAFFASEDGAVGVATALGPFAWVFGTIFAAAALTTVRGLERRRHEAWALVGLGGVLMQNVNITTLSAVRVAHTHLAGEPSGAALWGLHEALLGLNGTYLAVAMLGLSIAGVRGGLIRRWAAVLGFVAAALQFAAAVLIPWVAGSEGPLGLVGLAGWLLWVVWLIVYGIALIRWEPARAAGEQATATTRG